ncbi:MAG: flagellar motor protein MotB [bacterium]
MSDRKNNCNCEEDDTPSSPAWMTTYGDMMTLLMTFFILIMSFSSIQIDKFKAAMGSLQGAFGVLGHSKEVNVDRSWFSPFMVDMKREKILNQVDNLRELLEKNNLEDSIELSGSDTEVTIRFKDHILFPSGGAELKPSFLPIFKKITRIIIKGAGEVKVEGHTDNLPIHTSQYPSNWELSIARALSVLRYLVQEEGLNPTKLSAAGFSQFRPLVPNNSPDNRAKNRRVEIHLRW